MKIYMIQTLFSRTIPWVIILALIWFFLRYFEWKNLYYPARKITMTPEAARLEYEDINFIAEDGNQLHGWWIPHENPKGTVIVCHGNAGNIGDRVWVAADFHLLGLNVFLFDYRGYGNSKGLTSEKGIYRDARAAYEVVRTKHNDAEDIPVVVYGRSLGGAVAIQLALDKPVKGVIVESSFTSTVDMGKKLYPLLPVKLFCRDRYYASEKISRIDVPVVIAHSPDDHLIPFSMGKELYAQANEPKQFFELTGGHNDSGWSTSKHYWEGLKAYIDYVLP